MVLLGCKSATEKLASFLLYLTWRNAHGTTRTSPSPVPLPMTRGDIADHLGLTTETVSRTLSQLRAKGTIDIPTPRCVVVMRPRALAALTGNRLTSYI
jgi:CRP-like cAMP-binding protein